MTKQFEGEVEIQYEDQIIICNVKRLDLGSCSLEVTYPEDIAGMKLSIDSEKADFNYQGLTYSLSREKIPDSGYIKRLMSAIDSLPDVISASDSNYNRADVSYTGTSGSLKYTAYFDENGTVTKLIFES